MYKKKQAQMQATFESAPPPPPPPPPPAVAAPPPPLPPVQPTGWDAHNDEHDRIFYYNAATNETSWGEYDASTWEQRFFPGNVPYFFNTVTGRSVWQIPN